MRFQRRFGSARPLAPARGGNAQARRWRPR